MILENWALITRPLGFIDGYYLQGQVYGSDKFEDGKYITTSRLTGSISNDIKTTTGSVYELGEPCLKYEKMFPDAANRLFAALQEQ